MTDAASSPMYGEGGRVVPLSGSLSDKTGGRLTGPPKEPPDDTMTNVRLARVEEAIAGFRHSQNLMLGAVSLFALIMIGLGVYTLQRIDQVNDRVSEVPGKISSEMRDLTKTLADSITAAKQNPTQVILVPNPLPPPLPSPRPQQ